MGSVWKGFMRGPVGFRRTVAIKRLHASLADDDEALNAFVDEASLASRLSHPNIVSVLDFGLGKDPVSGRPECFMVQDYVEGVSLAALLAGDEPLALHVGLLIVHDVARGLEYAHGRHDSRGRPLHIVHRDITPRNILVSNHGEVKITDFGIAKYARSKTRTSGGQVKGRIGYLSPEQVRGEELDNRADLFLLGILLYEITTGRRLFDMQPLELAKRLDAYEGPSTAELARVPERIRPLARGLLAGDREQRIGSAAEVSDRLAGIIDAAGALAARAELMRRARAAHREQAEETENTHYITRPFPGLSDMDD